MKILIAYWSGTGNTRLLAEFLATEGKKNHEVLLLDTETEKLSENAFDFYFLGCPSMGAEELESDYFMPFYENLKPNLKGKKVILFGSYGWGDGEWMRLWEASAKSDGIDVVKSFIYNETPTDEVYEQAKTLLNLIK